MNKLLLGVAILGILLACKKKIIESETVRGIRNNNAGNIRAKSIIWDGKTGIDDKGFAIFKSPEWGISSLGAISTFRCRLIKKLK